MIKFICCMKQIETKMALMMTKMVVYEILYVLCVSAD